MFRTAASVSMNAMARSRRVQLILNGKVAGDDALRAAVAGQAEAGHRIKVRVTREKGDAQGFASEVGRTNLLIAAGGDGTRNNVSPGLRVCVRARGPCWEWCHWERRMTLLRGAEFRGIRRRRWRSA